MISLALYNWEIRKNKVNKGSPLDNMVYYKPNIYFKGEAGALNLSVEITWTEFIRESNYAVICDHNLKKCFYYFVESYTQKTNGICILFLHLDVLNQYRINITDMVKNGNMICIRSGTINAAPEQTLEDTNITIGARGTEDQDIIRFGNVLTWDNPYYVLTVAGSYGVFYDTATTNLESEVDNNENSEWIN